VSKCELDRAPAQFQTEPFQTEPSLLFLPSIKDRIVPRPKCSYASVYIVCSHTFIQAHICASLCVCLCDIFGWRKKYKHVSSAAIQSPPPPMGLSTPNIMSFILSVKIIDYTETDGWIHPSILSKRSQFFFKKAKNIWSTFSNKINALPPPHCFLKRKMFVKCNDTRCLMYRYVRSIKITKLQQHAVVLSENWSHFVHFPTRQKLEETF